MLIVTTPFATGFSLLISFTGWFLFLILFPFSSGKDFNLHGEICFIMLAASCFRSKSVHGQKFLYTCTIHSKTGPGWAGLTIMRAKTMGPNQAQNIVYSANFQVRPARSEPTGFLIILGGPSMAQNSIGCKSCCPNWPIEPAGFLPALNMNYTNLSMMQHVAVGPIIIHNFSLHYLRTKNVLIYHIYAYLLNMF